MNALYARFEHGGHKVVLHPPNGTSKRKSLEVWWPDGPIQYPTTRQALIALVNGTPKVVPGLRDPKTTFDRYFRRGKFQRESFLQVDTLELFAPPDPPKKPLAPARPLGIDLAKRGHEVRKLFYAGFARRVAARGHDPEEVLQELYKALLIRNRGKCPWDPQKSSFGHYVHMVAGCIISNYNRKMGRFEENEVFGVTDAEGVTLDVAQADLAQVQADQEELLAHDKARKELLGLVLMEAPNRGISPQLARNVFDLISEDSKMRDLRKVLGKPQAEMAEAVTLVKEVARLWKGRSQL